MEGNEFIFAYFEFEMSLRQPGENQAAGYTSLKSQGEGKASNRFEGS